MNSSTSNLTRGYGIALISALFLSTTAIFIGYLNNTYHIPAIVLAFWRDAIVAVTVLVVLLILRPAWLRTSRANLRYLLGYGLLLAVFNSAWTLSVVLNGAAVSTVLAYSSPAFTAVLGWWILKERLDWSKIVAVLFGIAGIVLVAGVIDPSLWKSNSIYGFIAGLATGLLYAIYSLMGRSASQRGLNAWTTLLYSFAFATVFLLIFNLIPGGPLPGSAKTPAEIMWLGTAWEGWAIVVALAAGPTVIGFGLYMVSLTYLPSSVANLIVTLEPVFTAISAYFILHESLTLVQIIGGLLIILGVVFLRIYEGRAASNEQSPVSDQADVAAD
jgi:drug/metabolite transporter (DMT)-like permease